MKRSRQLLVAAALVGLQLGRAPAQEPASPRTPEPSAVIAAALLFWPADPALPPASAPTQTFPMPQVTKCGCPTDLCCDKECGGCTPRGGFIAGAGFYVLQPYFSNNVAFGIQGTSGRAPGTPAEPAGTRFDDRVDVRHHIEVAPLVWLGYLSESGVGGRVRWWYFRQGTEQSAAGTGDGNNGVQVLSSEPLGLGLITATSGTGPAAIVATTKLQLQVWDFDTLYHLTTCQWDLLFVGGLRLASLDQTYNAYTAGEALLSSSVFSGIGPTLGLEARRFLGDTGFGLYGAARGAILFGSAHQSAAITDRAQIANDHRNIGMPVAEAELGLEYGRTVGAARFFGQVALVGQEWFGAGGASRSSTDVIPGGLFSTSSYVGDSDLAFLGLVIRAGVNY